MTKRGEGVKNLRRHSCWTTPYSSSRFCWVEWKIEIFYVFSISVHAYQLIQDVLRSTYFLYLVSSYLLNKQYWYFILGSNLSRHIFLNMTKIVFFQPSLKQNSVQGVRSGIKKQNLFLQNTLYNYILVHSKIQQTKIVVTKI